MAVKLPQIDPQVLQLIENRVRRIEIRDDSFGRRVQQARVLLNQGKYIDAQRDLEELSSNEDLSRSVHAVTAQRILDELAARERRRAEEMTGLLQAMRDDDADQVATLGRQLGLPRLPLSILSYPAGATVTRNGESLGITPLVLNDLRPERVDDVFELSVPGYHSVKLSPIDAVAGWRLSADLVRSPAMTAQIPGPITAQPGVIEGVMWFVGSNHAVSLQPDGTTQIIPFAELRILEEPIYAPARLNNGRVTITTRDQAVITIVGDQSELWFAPRPSNYHAVTYVSPLVLDRRVVITAGLNGSVAAGDAASGELMWQHRGASFVEGPLMRNDRIHVVRQDGQMQTISIEDGDLLASRSLGAPVVAAWRELGAIAGYTRTKFWRWNGQELVQQDLPGPIVAGAEGVVIDASLRVRLYDQAASTWLEVGRVSTNDGMPRHLLRWGDKAVLTWPQKMETQGERSFQLTTEAEFVDPALHDDQLVTATTTGQVVLYDP